MLDACDESNPDLGSLIYGALTTACRRGELCGLRWGDIDLDKATLVVARSISDASGEVIVKGTKTHQTRRIALDPSTVEVLRRQRSRADERAQLAGLQLGPASYVWSQDLDGSTPYRPDRVTAAFVGLRNRLGLRHLTFHELRHTSDKRAARRFPARRGYCTWLRGHSARPCRLRSSSRITPVRSRPRRRA